MNSHEQPKMLIDDISRDDLMSARGTSWQALSDWVMGAVSRATLRSEEHSGRRCLHLSGNVQLENNRGFVKIALDLASRGDRVDAHAFAGLRLVVLDNGERWLVHLLTGDIACPWPPYRAHFDAPAHWGELWLPFSAFAPHRIETRPNLRRLRRIGLVGSAGPSPRTFASRGSNSMVERRNPVAIRTPVENQRPVGRARPGAHGSPIRPCFPCRLHSVSQR